MKKEYDFTDAKRGPVISVTGKTRITIFIDDDILDTFRNASAKQGKGYQTLINEALRATLAPDAAPVTEKTLRRILREELHAV